MPSPVHQAIAAVTREVEPVTKERVAGLNYRIISEGAVMDTVRPAMIKHELAMIPVAVELLDSTVWTTAKGATMNRSVVRVTYRITHCSSGDHVDVQAVGEAADSGDKSCAKAATIAWKYAVRQTFAVITGDDPDHYNAGEKAVQAHGGVAPYTETWEYLTRVLRFRESYQRER